MNVLMVYPIFCTVIWFIIIHHGLLGSLEANVRHIRSNIMEHKNHCIQSYQIILNYPLCLLIGMNFILYDIFPVTCPPPPLLITNNQFLKYIYYNPWIHDIKQHRAWIVVGWMTAWKHRVLLSPSATSNLTSTISPNTYLNIF